MYDLISNKISILDKSGEINWRSNDGSLGVELSFSSLYNLPEGTIVSLVINKKEFLRTVVVKKEENKFSYDYTCFDFSFYLKNETIKQFNTNASAALDSLLRDFGIKSNIIFIPTKIKKIYKDESLASIIDDILEQSEQDQGIKYLREIQVDTIYIQKLIDMKITPSILINSDFSISSSIEELKNKIIVISNQEKNNSILATAESKPSQSLYGLLQEVETIEEKDIAKAKNIAANLLKDKNKIFKNTSLSVLGIKNAETIQANRLIEVNLGNKLKGWYKIKAANHSLKNNNHMVEIDLEW